MLCVTRNSKFSPRMKKGFTLLEMFIVTAIFSVVALAIYAALSNGIGIWQRVCRQLPEEDLGIFFDKFSRDIRNTFEFTGINFSGTIDKVEFPTLVNSPRLGKKTVGRLIYAYDPVLRTWNRRQMDFSAVYAGEDALARQALENIESLRFRYYLHDKEKNEYLWRDEWLGVDGLPLAVRVELEIDNGSETRKFVKTVAIPAGG